MDFIRKTGKFLLVIIIPATVWLVINSTVNGHYHKLQDGKIIYHCHPFKHYENNKSPFEDHHHSKSEYFILDQISHTLALFSVFLISYLITFTYKKINCFRVLILPSKKYFFSRNYRSPPVL